MQVLPKKRRPFLGLLASCFVAYVAFHAVRARLPPGLMRDSFPSFLAPLVMFAVIELSPRVRFRSRAIKYAVLAATTLVAIVWLEAIVPRFTSRATGDGSDALLLAAGGVAFVAFDMAFGNRATNSLGEPPVGHGEPPG